MGLSLIRRLVWDKRSVEHITRHQVTSQEVERACFGSQAFAFRRGERYIVLGRTGAGRYHGRVVTTRQMDEKERRIYRKKVR